MSNTVITNYTDLNGPSTKADSSVVVIVNKDGSLSVDQNLLGTLMGSDGSQGAGISVVRVGHEGRPDDATDSESEDDKVPHVTLSVDSYYDEPNSIIKYDSGAEMLQSLRIETRENSLVGFQNDHCYTPLTSPGHGAPQRSDSYTGYDEPVIEITHTPPPKPVPNSKKITILEQKIIPKGKKLVINPTDASVVSKSSVINKPLPVLTKSKQLSDLDKSSENSESSSISSGDSIPDRDSDSDYRDTKDRSGSLRIRKTKLKPRILKSAQSAKGKLEPKVASRVRSNKSLVKREIKEKIRHKNTILERKQSDASLPTSSIPTTPDTLTGAAPGHDQSKVILKQTPKPVKREKKTPAHVTALLTDMTSLFSTPDVIRRVSTDGKTIIPTKSELSPINKKPGIMKPQELIDIKLLDTSKLDNLDKTKPVITQKIYLRPKVNPTDKVPKSYDPIPQIDDVSLAQILQDPTGISSVAKVQPSISAVNVMSSPGLAGPLSPTLDLLGGLQPEEEGLTEDLLMHVAQLVESSENLQEVIDKQVLGKVDSVPVKTPVQSPFQQQAHSSASMYAQTPIKSVKSILPRKDPIEIVRRDGRVITLPPIEAPATRSSKRKSQMETSSTPDVMSTPSPILAQPAVVTPEPQVQQASKQYINKKLTPKKPELIQHIQQPQSPVIDKITGESQESWNSEDDPYRLWCICKQPHNNRFMICCDSCEDWFHGKCVNITKAMGQQMEEQGIEWRCPNCIKKTKGTPKTMTPKNFNKQLIPQKKHDDMDLELNIPQNILPKDMGPKTSCIVCKRPARASSIYCSDACILKHAQDSLGNQPTKPDSEPGKHQDKKSDSRVIVYERKSGRLLAGPNAPTAENLKTWLQRNPTFEVVRPGALSTIRPNVIKKKATNEPHKIQTTLNFEKVPRKSVEQSLIRTPQSERVARPLQSPREEIKEMKLTPPQPRTPVTTRSHQPQFPDTPRPSTSATRSQQSQFQDSPKPSTSATRSQQSQRQDSPKPSTSAMRSQQSQYQDSPRPSTSATRSQQSQYQDTPRPSTSMTRSQQSQYQDTPRPSTSTAKFASEPKKTVRATSTRSQSAYDKAPSVSPSTSRKKEAPEPKRRMDSEEPIRDNVRKALQEQMGIRMAENTGDDKTFNEEEIQDFANDTESELHELFKDVGMKYKAKYRSLMFNLKDRKNLSLWQKICDGTITPYQLVRLSPEELASQELAQWRDKEVKHQLELIKKSELDLLAATKTYVLKTHKGEEVIHPKESVETELDPNVRVEDVVIALNDSTVGEAVVNEVLLESPSDRPDMDTKHESSKKRGRDNSTSRRTKKSRKESKRESERKKSRSSRRRSDLKEREGRSTRRSSKKRSSRARSLSKVRSKKESSKELSDLSERVRHRSRSRAKSKRRSKSRDSRSASKGRERSPSRERLRRRSQSQSKESTKRRRSSRSKHIPSTEEKIQLRSRSQDNVSVKAKNDSTDSDSVERPKSAMLKEVHPEYDPHEPMITSAFSEEDLRKTGADSFEDNYKNEMEEYGETEFDPTKDFAIDTSVILPPVKFTEKQEKVSEPESDQEPSSTVDNSSVTVWNGCINMVDVARFYVAAHEVSGNASDLEEDLSTELDIVGRIKPATVWDYISKMKRASNKDIIILKLQAANDEEKMQYIALYSYLSSRNRLGVVKDSNTNTVKDFYIVPLPANTALPEVLLPLDGPGLGEVKTHLLIAIVIRQRKKRPAPHIPKDIVPAKVARESRKRSYTPPVPVVGKSSYTPPTSPRRRTALPLPASFTSPALSTSVKDKIAASLAAADDEEAYSPGSSTSSGSASAPAGALPVAAAPVVLRHKVEEINRQIEEQKQQIMKMAQADSSMGEDEAYSPSRPMTPPAVNPLDDIALPSNLHEILATIKQRSETNTDVDMRNLPLP